jgi:hypothetical protein
VRRDDERRPRRCERGDQAGGDEEVRVDDVRPEAARGGDGPAREPDEAPLS